MKAPEVVNDVVMPDSQDQRKEAARRAALSCIDTAIRFIVRQMAAVCSWAAWACPILLILRLSFASPTSRMLLWLACGLVAILAYPETAQDRDLTYSVYFSAACGLVVGLVIAAGGL